MILSKFLKSISSLLTVVLLSVFLFGSSTLMANEESHSQETSTEHAEKAKFNAGEMILGHILDDHSWHVMDIGEHAISIPLPIIIYDNNGSGMHFFMSSKFEHGHASYDGYKLDGKKIVRVDDSVEGLYDFSITKVVFSLIVASIFIFFLFMSVAKAYVKNKGKAPSGVQGFIEPIILFVRDDLAKPSIGPKYEKFMPFLLSIFFFILINNLLGLVPFFPGGANVTGNISVTLVLAVFTLICTTINANKNYWVHIFNMPGVPWWLKLPVPLMPLVEILGFFTKPFVLMVRLFANITAGHIVILGFMSIIFIFGELGLGAGYGASIFSTAFSVFISVLEILVAFIQAYVFTLLSAMYLGMAVEEEH